MPWVESFRRKERPGIQNRFVFCRVAASRKFKRYFLSCWKRQRHFPEYDFVLAAASSILWTAQALYGLVSRMLGSWRNKIRPTENREGLVKSGTSTLETALIGVPQVVCYSGNPISYAIARRLVTIQFISLVNRLNTETVCMIQHELSVENLRRELKRILTAGEAYAFGMAMQNFGLNLAERRDQSGRRP